MANQFATELSELFKAATGYDVSSGTVLAALSYVGLALLALLGRRTPAIKAYVAARPRLAAIVGMLEAVGFDGKKLREEAANALTPTKK
jgi:hypothetical protein